MIVPSSTKKRGNPELRGIAGVFDEKLNAREAGSPC
jgi:hypothetical protein